MTLNTMNSTADRMRSAPIYFAMFAPIVGLAVMAALAMSKATQDQSRFERLSGKIALSTEASNLAHELQKERGMSAGHVGSKGAQFGPQLTAQRAVTDAALAEIAAAVTLRSGGETAPERRIDARSARLADAFAQLGEMRAQIDALETTVPALAKFYTDAIRDLLSLPDDPLISGHLEEIARLNTIYKDILMAKEFAGVERAAGSVGFGRGGFDDATFAWYNGLQQRQLYLFERIRDLGDDAERAILDAALQSGAAQQVAELRALAAESLQTGDVKGVTGPAWFDASTAYLGELRKMERAFATSIQAVAAQRADAAWIWAMGLGLAVATFLAAFGIFGYRYVHSMIGSLRGLRDAIIRIERAEDDITVPSLRRRDAIGEIARSLAAISAQGADAARVRAGIAASDTPFLVLDSRGRSVFENAAFAMLAERRRADVEPLAPPMAAGGRDATRMLAALKQAEAQGRLIKKSRGEDAIELTLGETILEARVSPVRNEAGQEIGATLQLADVSEVRQLEKDVLEVLQSVERGEFSMRVSRADDLGFTSVAARGLNQQMDGIETFMRALETSLEAMAAGDLTRRMDNPFEGDFERARQNINANLQALVSMVLSVSGAATDVQKTSRPIALGARNLAERAEEQAAALEEVNATMEEMSKTIARSAERAQSAANLASDASDRAAAGHAVLAETRDAMGRIEDSASKVVEIVAVIDSIAFQTNLLALNAAVEAARAGDAGKGFAVVASEVRTLAQRSSEAASEIRGLINESSGNVAAGVDLMEKTKSALDQINTSIVSLNDVIAQIAADGEEQASGAKEISTTTMHLDGLTQQNASVAQESAHGAELLRSQADQLMEQVGRFTTGAPPADRDVA